MEDDELGACRRRDARGVVEHPDRHVQFLAALGVAHEARDRSVDGEDDARLVRELAEPLRPLVVHPELPLEVDLAGGEAAHLEELDRLLGALPGGNASRPVLEQSHCASMRECPPRTVISAASSRQFARGKRRTG
jgi:hypothetical protein